ncbi:MAG: hypothetical protein ACYTGL_19610 [Planctomycetota bacterium]|jgi:hypothetical protein
MAKSRAELRRMAEAAEALEKASPKTKKKATRKKATRRAREKAPERKRAVWVIYSSSMKEEGRYAYDQKEAAEEKLEALRSRGKRLYFMQMVKELITDGSSPVVTIEPVVEDEELDESPVTANGDESDSDEEMSELEVDDSDFEENEEEEEPVEEEED